MWKSNVTSEERGRVLKLSIDGENGRLSYLQFLELLRDSADFRSFFGDQLAATEFTAFRWETPPVNASTVKSREFECVLVDDPGLERTPDVEAFADFYQSHATDDVATFPNLSKDAVLVVPCPVAEHSAYGHLAAFLREAPADQHHSLWQQVAEAMFQTLPKRTVWLSTAGAGVSWLHVRLDSRPKYYSYQPYGKSL